jgi:hypothetical protein
MTFIKHHTVLAAAIGACVLLCAQAGQAVTTVFFNAFQTATVVATNMTSTTISSSGYLFTYSLDKWWYAEINLGPGTPTGRPSSITWPNGVEAQTLTAGPTGVLATQVSAIITIRRMDGMPFDMKSFTAQVLGNTGGAGASFEIMPQLNGQDAFANPLLFDATGYGGANYTYDTPMLTGYDTYNISLWMDYALTSLTLVDASLPPTLQISLTSSNYVGLSWPTNSTGFTVQQNSNLAITNWVNATDAVNIVNANYQASIPTTNGTRFFRLGHP